MVKIRTVAMNDPISPIATTSLYVANAIHKRRSMSATLTASALNAAYSASPADFDLPRAANATKTSPAMIPIEPPNAAEIAPCIPASQADNKLAVAVHKTCSPIIGRNTCHTLHPAAAKPQNSIGKETSPSNPRGEKWRESRRNSGQIG